MNRNLWKFNYTSDILLKAATEKLNWHKERHDWWSSKKEEIMTIIKASGLEIDESVAMGYSNSGRQTSVNIRTDLLKDLNECVSKIDEHKRKIADYDSWVQVFENRGNFAYDLDQDDWLFFFGK